MTGSLESIVLWACPTLTALLRRTIRTVCVVLDPGKTLHVFQ